MGAFDSSIGAVLIATWLCSMLEVTIIRNVYSYFTRHKEDHIFLKLLVIFVVIVDIAGLVAGYVLLYMTCVTFWGNPIILMYQYWPVELALVTTDVVAFIVQAFLIHRVWVLTKNWIICAVMWMTSMVSFIACIWVTIIYAKNPLYNDRSKAKEQVIVWIATTTATDILITTTLIWRFYNMKTTFKQTESILQRLIRGAMQTGAATSVCAILTLFFYLIQSGTNLGGAAVFLLARCYTLTLLYNLNLRGVKSSGGTSHEKVVESPHRMAHLSYPAAGMLGGIEVHRMAHVHIDGEENASDTDQKSAYPEGGIESS
ncbi:hypothetical protein PM082_012598 [Marasmius tenuissimus]|nr:hypothetical protein PM082_012598 [Marasmius tenuissimus]